MIQIIKSSKNLNFLIYTHNMIIWLSQGCRNYFSMHINLGKNKSGVNFIAKKHEFPDRHVLKGQNFLIINSEMLFSISKKFHVYCNKAFI